MNDFDGGEIMDLRIIMMMTMKRRKTKRNTSHLIYAITSYKMDVKKCHGSE